MSPIPPAAPEATLAQRRQRGRWRLGVAVAVVLCVWLVVLPRLAETTAVRAMIDRNERLGIDPSAMYYSDLQHLEFRDSMLRRRHAEDAAGDRGR